MNNTKPQHIPQLTEVTYLKPEKPRPQPIDNILENRWLHQVFVLTHDPATWPVWKLAAGVLALTALVGTVWRLIARAGAGVTRIVYLLFALGDWLLFWQLPRRGHSFGPVGPQLYVSSIPRVGAALVGAVTARATGSVVAGAVVHSALQLFGTFTFLWGALVEPFALSVTRQSVGTPQSAVDALPLRLLHLSDFHVERLTRREPYVLRLIDDMRPDLIVITGDYLNLSYVDDPTARAEARKILQELQAPLGVFATLGSPPVDPRATTPSLFDGLDIRLLRDEVAVLKLADGRKISLIGMDCEHDLDSDGAAFESLIKRVPPKSACVLLYHSPELMPLVQHYPVDLYLCGHTHGGQFRAPQYGAILTSSITGKQYEMGRYDENGTTLYVSRGIGLEGLSAPRMRLLCRPEIILWDVGVN